MNVTNESTKTKQLKYYNLSEVEIFLADYEEWYLKRMEELAAADSGSNPGTPPPPPPGHNP